jgi:hypothetical protein
MIAWPFKISATPFPVKLANKAVNKKGINL